jgi:serine protease inhibitor
MRRIITLITVIITLLCLSSGLAIANEIQNFTQDNNIFALSLYRWQAQEYGNIVCSPLSIYTAMGMTYSGARSETARQMQKALRFSRDQKQMSIGFRKIKERLDTTKSREHGELIIANALWGQKGFEYFKDFIDEAKDNYGCELRVVDFAKKPKEVCKSINSWIEGKTKGEIDNLVKPHMVTRQSRLFLTNAIYLKASWHKPFKKNMTKDEPFYLSSGETVNCQMMQNESHYRYYENSQLKMIEIPYARHNMSMIVILPRDTSDLATLENTITIESLQNWVASLEHQSVQVLMPKYSLKTDVELIEYLTSKGMVDAFDSRADFSGISSIPLWINAVAHQAMIDVDEFGTTAAAASLAGMTLGFNHEKPKSVVFRADHPFLFVIQHFSTGAILFIGRVQNPKG